MNWEIGTKEISRVWSGDDVVLITDNEDDL